MASPYENLPPQRFWRTAVSEVSPPNTGGLYARKFPLDATDKIVAAGSCFAQHITHHMRRNGLTVLDYEPAPPGLPEEIAKQYGYGIYSARYGNIYAARQLLQLAEDAIAGRANETDIWVKDGRYFDSVRPSVEPNGFASIEEAMAHRRWHLGNVLRLFDDMTVFIFTFGLTEAWVNRASGRVYPMAPGTIAGEYDPAAHVFHNFTSREIYDDFVRFRELIKARNPGVKILVTVSPVPLTATASDDHVLVANTYSKSALRAVAGELSKAYDDVDYFPSYEIVASHWSKGKFYEDNLRSVTTDGVNTVMRTFFAQHGGRKGALANRRARKARKIEAAAETETTRQERAAKRTGEARAARKAKRRAKRNQEAGVAADDAVCEEVLLDAFSK